MFSHCPETVLRDVLEKHNWELDACVEQFLAMGDEPAKELRKPGQQLFKDFDLDEELARAVQADEYGDELAETMDGDTSSFWLPRDATEALGSMSSQVRSLMDAFGTTLASNLAVLTSSLAASLPETVSSIPGLAAWIPGLGARDEEEQEARSGELIGSLRPAGNLVHRSSSLSPQLSSGDSSRRAGSGWGAQPSRSKGDKKDD